MFDVDRFLAGLQALDASGEDGSSQAIDLIFAAIDDLLLAADLEAIHCLIVKANPRHYSTDLCIALLAMTRYADHHLGSARHCFYARLLPVLDARGTPDIADHLMKPVR